MPASVLLTFGAVTLASDRLVEFSARTFPRLDQLTPAPTPTTLVPLDVGHTVGTAPFATQSVHRRAGNFTVVPPNWTLSMRNGQMSPTANPSLCLSAARPAVSSPVELLSCTAMAGAPPPRGGRTAMALATADATATTVGRSHWPGALPHWYAAGIIQSLSLATCDSGDGGTRWESFNGSAGPLVTMLRGTVVGLYSDSIHPGARATMNQLAPLLTGGGAGADQVLVGCFGWMLDLALAFTGESEQPLPIVDPESPQWSTGNATYGELRILVCELRTAAAARGLHRLKLGALFVGWAHLYNLRSAFATRHPEIYMNDGAQLAHGLAWSMAADKYPYASHPSGVVAGASFFKLFGAQWAALSVFLGLDAVVLRDGLSGFARGGRHGPFGDTASKNATANQRWIDGVRELFRQTKLAAPHTTVLGYSQQGSAVGIYRVGLSDVEQLVADGFIDAWVDQSWAGAWEDVPTRYAKSQGWT